MNVQLRQKRKDGVLIEWRNIDARYVKFHRSPSMRSIGGSQIIVKLLAFVDCVRMDHANVNNVVDDGVKTSRGIIERKVRMRNQSKIVQR